jgi:hypothetical protein
MPSVQQEQPEAINEISDVLLVLRFRRQVFDLEASCMAPKLSHNTRMVRVAQITAGVSVNLVHGVR